MCLICSDDNLELISDLDCVTLLVDAVKNNMDNAKIVKNACMALASLVEPDGKR